MSEQLSDTEKEELKLEVAIMAIRWTPYSTPYDEDAFFADIDNGTITTKEQISTRFQIDKDTRT